MTLRYLVVLASLLPSLAAAQSDPQVASRIDSAIQAAAPLGFSGVVLVSQRGQVVYDKAFGNAIESPRTPFTTSTLVQIGSNVKDFTKVAVYQLIEAGRLSLADSLGRFFPGVPPDKRGITVQQLLEHTAGFGLGVGSDDAAVPRDSMLRIAFSRPLEGPRYSNLGYSLLAAIIENVSGEPFDRYVADHILQPLGMRETGSYLPHFDPARIAHGYQGGQDHGSILDKPHDADGHLYQLRGNGGYLSTTHDMLRFYAGIPQLLTDPAHRRAVVNPDGPSVLAGSDLISFFLFANFPGPGLQVIIGTNHSEAKGNMVLGAVTGVFGIVTGGPGGQRVVGGGSAPSGPLTERLPDTGAGHTVSRYLDAYNSGDTAVMRRFLESFPQNPNAPPMATRLERYRGTFENLGRVRMRGWRRAPDGAFQVVAETAQGQTVTFTLLVDEQAPFALQGLRLEVG